MRSLSSRALFARPVVVTVLLGVIAATACGGSSNTVVGGDGTGDGGTSSGSDAGSTGADGSASDAGKKPKSDASAASDGASSGDGNTSDTLSTSFVFLGCNRIKKSDWDSSGNPASANVPQLQRTFADVNALGDKPQHLFFTGDLVLALVPGTNNLSAQLDAWATLYKSDPIAANVPVVPMPGNHEMLYKDSSSGLELSNAPADALFSGWLHAQGFDTHAGNGPTSAPPNADALSDDQSKLSYSFDDGDVHYVVLNTDTLTTTPDPNSGSTLIGWTPLHWLTGDLGTAQANPNIHHIFVFGHKPLESPKGGSPSPDDTIASALVPDIESLFDQTPKMQGYFCAHAHLWDARKLPGNRGVYQVTAGNGGSPLEAGWNVSSPWYGFTEARIYSSGRVGIVDHQRAVPTPYYGSPADPATAAPEIVISP